MSERSKVTVLKTVVPKGTGGSNPPLSAQLCRSPVLPENTIRSLPDLDLQDRKVFMRVDFNVPLRDGQITDDSRVHAALPSIKYVLERAKLLVLASHLGRPQEGKHDPAFSLEPVATHLAQLLQREVVLLRDYSTDNVAPLAQMTGGALLLMENLRFHAGEKQNSPEFTRQLATGFDVYLNEAFGTLHRKHASVSGMPALFPPADRGIGLLVGKELTALDEIMHAAQRPFVFIIGGAKVSDKIAVILNMLKYCHTVIIGGGMAYSFLRHQGHNVGKSKVDTRQELVTAILRSAAERGIAILLPQDHIAAAEFSEQATPVQIDSPALPDNLMGLDIGPRTIEHYGKAIDRAGTVLWNGPMGVCEWENFARGTHAVAAACHASHAITVVGGGDSVAAVRACGLTEGFTHISTGGGASLKYLEGEPLVGLQALIENI